MPEFANLSCPSCGAKLQISNDLKKFACGHCGNEHVVKRDGGVISLSPVIEQLKGVRVGVDKTASELAISRLRQEIGELKIQRDNITNAGCLAMIFSNNCSGLGAIALLGFFLAVFVGIQVFSMDVLSAAGWFIVGFIVIIAAIAGLIDWNSENDASNQRNLLNKKIAEKNMDMEKHENIVSGK